jgi:hypothetical protein
VSFAFLEGLTTAFTLPGSRIPIQSLASSRLTVSTGTGSTSGGRSSRRTSFGERCHPSGKIGELMRGIIAIHFSRSTAFFPC